MMSKRRGLMIMVGTLTTSTSPRRRMSGPQGSPNASSKARMN